MDRIEEVDFNLIFSNPWADKYITLQDIMNEYYDNYLHDIFKISDNIKLL